MKLIFAIILFFSLQSNGQVINASRPYVNQNVTIYECKSLLDTFSSSLSAYSLMKIRNNYSGYAIRVRRSNDNAETDIGFSGCELDTSALKSFVGSNSGYVVTWYDQSGNGNNSTQSTSSWQTKIMNSGTIYRLNGKPSTYFDGTAQLALAHLAYKSRVDIYFVQSTSDAQYVQFSQTNDYGNRYGFVGQSGNGAGSTSVFGTPSLYTNNSPQTSSTRANIYTALNGNKIATIQNGDMSVWTGCVFGRYTTFEWTGYLQELIVWDSDQSSNRSGIVSNMNYRYSVF